MRRARANLETDRLVPDELEPADTDRPVLWLWMAIASLGIGPSFAVFTLVVQNAVAPQQIGVATSSLTFFQQIGGTIGLTLAGTVFASRFAEEIPVRLHAAGVPSEFASQFAGGGGGGVDLAGTADPGHRRGDLRLVLDRGGDELLRRHRGGDHRRGRGGLPARSPDARDVRDDRGRARLIAAFMSRIGSVAP